MKLRLSGLPNTLKVRLHEAVSHQPSYEVFLELALQDELLVRNERLVDPGVWSKYCAPWKGGDFQWVQVPPRDGSLQPVAIGAAEEVANPSKPLVKRVAFR